MKLSSFLTGALVALALTTSGTFAAEKIKVGFVYVGPVGDGGWTYEHDQGRKAVEAEFGNMVETVYVESVPGGTVNAKPFTLVTRVDGFAEPNRQSVWIFLGTGLGEVTDIAHLI